MLAAPRSTKGSSSLECSDLPTCTWRNQVFGSFKLAQAFLERSTCNHAINKAFSLTQVQAALDLSTCTWLKRMLPSATGFLSVACPPEPCAGCPPPHSATTTLLPHPQCLSAGCRGRPLSRCSLGLWRVVASPFRAMYLQPRDQLRVLPHSSAGPS